MERLSLFFHGLLTESVTQLLNCPTHWSCAVSKGGGGAKPKEGFVCEYDYVWAEPFSENNTKTCISCSLGGMDRCRVLDKKSLDVSQVCSGVRLLHFYNYPLWYFLHRAFTVEWRKQAAWDKPRNLADGVERNTLKRNMKHITAKFRHVKIKSVDASKTCLLDFDKKSPMKSDIKFTC